MAADWVADQVCGADLPVYGSAAWVELDDTDRCRSAAVAAEMWRRYGARAVGGQVQELLALEMWDER